MSPAFTLVQSNYIVLIVRLSTRLTGNIINLDSSENGFSHTDANSPTPLSEQDFSRVKSSKTDKKTRIMSPSSTSISSSMTRVPPVGGSKDEVGGSIDAVGFAQDQRPGDRQTFNKATPLQPIKEHGVEYEESSVSNSSKTSNRGHKSKVTKQLTSNLREDSIATKAHYSLAGDERSLPSSKKSSSHSGLNDRSRLRKSREV